MATIGRLNDLLMLSRPNPDDWNPPNVPHVVTYMGFVSEVVRKHPSRERAIQWARSVGVLDRATVTPA